ncbi:C4-dicarboxylate ABC transporter [candidate division KSB3 bacterium]|uniref:C4-dicarboxylate ABC transporter n=1 Tax=candidate division KSB3 bacterium TaxID=2044937 RepID=A0A2G6E705_9BACT|nr:MAG: C4-dicarboxylate ABC transporter [candidate division KSB3 bacterium]PIE30129.1 MAG: C4-dicarboxylate ABC transporter [candidate division KSB3 bacterium]
MKKCLFLLAFVVACAAIADAETVSMRLAENQPDSNPVSVAMYKFAELAAEKSNGEIKIDVYTNAQLGQEPESIEQVQLGVIEFARVNSVVLANVAKEMGVFTLPYIFRGTEHKFNVLDGPVGESVLKSLEKYGMIGLGYMEAGTRCFYTTEGHKIEKLADLKGLKIRVQPAPISIKMMELLGATPTPMNYGEVYSALQTGVIDGAENDYVSYETSSHYEVAKFYTVDGHLSPPALLLMNLKSFNALSPEHQQIVKEAAAEAVAFERKAMLDHEDVSKDKVLAAGVEVIEIDNSEFQEAVQPIYDEFPEYKEVIEEIKATK